MPSFATTLTAADVDSRTGYQLMHTLEALAKERGKRVVAVSHDQRIEDVADRVLWLEDGELADRPPGERSVAGTRFVFCSELCLERINSDPRRYTEA